MVILLWGNVVPIFTQNTNLTQLDYPLEEAKNSSWRKFQVDQFSFYIPNTMTGQELEFCV